MTGWNWWTARVGAALVGVAVAVAIAATAAVTPARAAGGLVWSAAATTAPGAALNAVSCPSTSFCIAGDRRGRIWTSTNPFAADPTWTNTYTDTAGEQGGDPADITGVSCFGGTEPTCAVSDQVSDVLTSSDPQSPNPNWTVDPTISNSDLELDGLTCISQSLCVAISGGAENDYIYGSTDPFVGPSPTWTATQDFTVYGNDTGVSCPASSLCTAVEGGSVLISTDAGSTSPTWNYYPTPDGANPAAAPTAALEGIACPSTTLCVADDSSGGVLTSAAPGQANPTYVRDDVDGTVQMNAMSCYSTTLCAAGDASGDVVMSTDPGSASPTWTVTNISSHPIESVACASATQCVAVDSFGDVYTTGGAGGTVSTTTTGATPTTTTAPTVSRPTTTTSATTTTAPRPTVHAAVSTGTGARFSVVCPAGGGCAVRSVLLSGATRHATTFGTGVATVPAGQVRTLTVTLNASGRRDLARRHRLTLLIEVTVRRSGQTVRHVQRLTIRRR